MQELDRITIGVFDSGLFLKAKTITQKAVTYARNTNIGSMGEMLTSLRNGFRLEDIAAIEKAVNSMNRDDITAMASRMIHTDKALTAVLLPEKAGE